MSVFEIHDRKITELPPIPEETTELNCSYCTSLTSILVLPNLTELYCFGCTSLTSLPVLPKLARLSCGYCTSLTSLPVLPKLTRLHCSNCTSLTALPNLPNLTRLWCGGCTSLQYLPKLPVGCDYNGPTLPTEEEYYEEKNRGWVKKYEEFKNDDNYPIPLIPNLENIVTGYMTFATRKSPKKLRKSPKRKSRKRKSK